MICDFLVDWRRYVPHRHASEFCQAMEFLRQFTPDRENGKYVLLEDRVYANVQSYVPRDLAQGVVEYHREFVDLQTVLAGEEDIYYVPTAGLAETKAYDAAGDYGLFAFDAKEAVRCRLTPGNFVIFFPEEGHMPCIAATGKPAEVKKVVLKLHRSLFE